MPRQFIVVLTSGSAIFSLLRSAAGVETAVRVKVSPWVAGSRQRQYKNANININVHVVSYDIVVQHALLNEKAVAVGSFDQSFGTPDRQNLCY
jgi:hypothetical protein